MLDRLAQSLGITTTLAWVLLVLIAVQLATQVYGLVDLARRDRVRNAPKWLWALVIIFGNLVGAIAYLVIGRHPVREVADGDPGAGAAGGDAARRAVDSLYGPRDRQ